MAPVRVLFVGNAEACVPWVGLAKKLSRQCYHAGVINKVYHVADGVRIRVENVLPAVTAFGNKMGQDFGAICKVWIEAGGEGEGYQFAVTDTPNLTVLVDGFFYTLSSAVFVPWPDPRKNQRWVDVKPVATGSMLREDTADPKRWTYYDVHTAADVSSANASVCRFNFGLQIDGVPPATQYTYRSPGDTPKPIRQVYYSGASCQGQVRMAGAYMPTYGFITGDNLYDRAPQTKSGKKYTASAPDADWYHDAATVLVDIPSGGQAVFVVMADAGSNFYAWPLGTTRDAHLSDGSLYTAQAIKTNIPPTRAVKAAITFPAWVYDTTETSQREFYRVNGHTSFEPRYVWRFHPFENRVVGTCLHREKPAYDVLKKTAESGLHYNFVFEVNSTLTPASVYAKRKLGAAFSSDTTLSEIQEDTPGIVEFAFTIRLNSQPVFDADTCTFTFEMESLRDKKAEVTEYPIAAAYLNPVQGVWEDRGVIAAPGDLLYARLRVFEHPLYCRDSATIFLQGRPNFVQNTYSRVQVEIINWETDALVRRIPLVINDESYGLSFTEPGADTTAVFGKILQMELEEFSWLVRYEKTTVKKIPGTEFNVLPYPDVSQGHVITTGQIYSGHIEDPASPEDPFPYPIDDDGEIFGAESQIGIRFVHRNQTRIEEKYGVDLGIFETVDAADAVVDVSEGIELGLETKRLFLYESEGSFSYTNKLDQLFNNAYINSIVYPTDSVATVFGNMASVGYIDGIAAAYPDWKPEYLDGVVKPLYEAAALDPTGSPSALDTAGAALRLGKRKIHSPIIPGDFFYTLPGYQAPLTASTMTRIQEFNEGVNGYMRVWNYVVGESYRQYFKTGPDGFYAIYQSIPHINSTEPLKNPITGEIIGLPEPTKPFPVGVGFHRWGWANHKTLSASPFKVYMNDSGVLFEFLDALETVEPDMGNIFQPFTTRVVTLATIDEIGFETTGHPKTTHLELFRRAFFLTPEQVARPEFLIKPTIYALFYAGSNPVIGIRCVQYSDIKTKGGTVVATREREAQPLGIATIPGLRLYQANDTEIDNPRFNAAMSYVGSGLTGWYLYPEGA